MHIRGSSRKDNIDFRQELQVFFLHDDSLYFWTVNKTKLQFITRIDCPLLLIKDDSHFFIRNDIKLKVPIPNENDDDIGSKSAHFEEIVLAEQITMVKINFITFEIIPIYRESSITDNLVQFYYDRQENKFLLILKSQGDTGDDLIEKTKFQVYCLDRMKIIYECILENQELIGRLCIGLHTFCGGHIYFGNTIIKIRYDLIESPNGYTYTED